MHLSDLLFESADALQAGDLLLPEALYPILDEARDQLEDWALELEKSPHPAGLEGFDDSFVEALDHFFEAIDLLELAVSEQVPELALTIKAQTQDAVDILRDIQEQAESHRDILFEELGARG